MEILVLCIFFSCILLLPSSPSPASAATVFNDASALLQFKESSVSVDPNGFLNNWKSNNSTSPCSWNGVFCPPSGGPVRGLNLSNMGLAGRINLDILMSVSTLRHLDLHGNHFSSNLSTAASPACGFITVDLSSNNISASLVAGFLSTCNGLVYLNLSHNSIGGVLPIGSPSLRSLDLAHNNFSLELSTFDFSGCGPVTVLDISSNRLTAGLPPSLANCSNLQRLNLSNNQLTGGIPAELAQTCSTLTELDLSANKLTGGVPPAFAGCSSLQSLILENNEMSGDFVELVIGTMPALRSLHLAFNNLSRPVPLEALNNVSTLEVIDLSSNELTGVIPTDLCSYLLSLQRLLLPNNFISGTVPGELGNCVNLESVDLSFNLLTGPIPLSVWSLPKLTDLIMWANNLSGEIPDTLCSANATLEMLILSHNLISGTIPSSIIKCKNLIWVSLSSNRLTGGIPTGMGDNLPDLAILQIGNNFLSGNIPPDLGRCQSLIWLDLNNNTLTGPIPPSLASQTGLIVPGSVSGKEFAFLRHAAGNVCPGAGELFEFEGIRPERLAEFPLVHSCPATRIYIGTTVYLYTANGSMIYLDLSYNLLNGTIPVSFGSMEYLQVMNLGHNDLTGKIPESFGGLKNMLGLDLSHNHLTGSIPGILGTLSFLDDLDVSFNDLSGPIPGSGQLTTFPATRYENNSGLCGPPLLPCSHGGGNGNNSGFRKQSSISTEGSLLIGAAVCVSIVGLLILVLYRLKQHQKKDRTLGYIEELQSYSGTASWKFSGALEPLSISVSTFEKPLRNLTFAQLLEATNGFNADSLIGSGGFGEVYKARLKDDSIVAIKKLIQITGQGDREFMAEMETIGKIKHRNLVPLLGYCKVGDERLLVYEYMKHGSLDMVLHDKSNRGGCSKLDWPARKKIAIGAARGLAFLHHSCIPHIIHRDMKSSNVLLDDNLEARVSDFGMARLMNALDTHLSVSTLAGTPGYVPPEYYQSFRCTTKGDVYSYGVVLLELVSGKKPIDTIEFGDNNLVGWVKQMVKENRSMEIFDPVLMGKKSDESEMYQYLKIACQCLDDRSLRRPTMIQVMAMFKELQSDPDSDFLDGFSVGRIIVEELREKTP